MQDQFIGWKQYSIFAYSAIKMVAIPDHQTRQEILDSMTRIKELAQQPSDFLTNVLVQQQQYTAIEWLWKFQVLHEIPLRKSISYVDVAAKLQMPESTLRSVARMAMTADFLCETKSGNLAHNPLSTVFVEDDDMATWMSYMIHRSVPCMRTFAQATKKWPGTTKGNETAYNLAMDTDLSFFDHLRANPDFGAEFGRYMKSQSTVHTGASVDHLVQGLDWAALGKSKIVDVGDFFSQGLESKKVLMRHRLAGTLGAPRLHWQGSFRIYILSSKIFPGQFTVLRLKPNHFRETYLEGSSS